MDQDLDKDPLAMDPDILGFENIELIVEEDSENPSDNLTGEHLNEENIILYVESDNDDDDDNEDDDAEQEYNDSQNESTVDEIEYMTDDETEDITIEQDDASTSEKKQNANKSVKLHPSMASGSSTVSNIGDTPTKLRSRKGNFNESFLSFVGNEVKKKDHFKQLEKVQSNNNDKKDNRNLKVVIPQSESLITSSPRKRLSPTRTESPKRKKLVSDQILAESKPSPVLTKPVVPSELVTKTQASIVEQQKSVLKTDNLMPKTPVSNTLTPLPPTNPSFFYVLPSTPTGNLLPQTQPGNTPLKIAVPVNSVPGLPGMVPMVLPSSVLQAINPQAGQTLVIMPHTPTNVTNKPGSTPPVILGSTPPSSTGHKNLSLLLPPTVSTNLGPVMPGLTSFAPILPAPSLPIISNVRSVPESSATRKINILSKSKSKNSTPQKVESASTPQHIDSDSSPQEVPVDSATETVAMMVDGEEIIVTAPTNLKENVTKMLGPPLKTYKKQLFQITDLQANSDSNKDTVKITQANLCYVPNCTIQKGEKVYLFGVPVDRALMDMWDISIGRKDRKLNSTDIVCEKHFSEDDIIFVKNSLTESDTQQEKPKPKLRKGAIPCLEYYKNCCVPNCLNTQGKMYKFPIFSQPNLELWLYLVKNANLKNLTPLELLKHRVCAKHFEKSCFEKNGELIKTAAPTLNLLDKQASIDAMITEVQHPNSEGPRSLTHLKCLYPECDKANTPTKRVFRFPINFARCKKWLAACDRLDLVCSDLRQTDRLLRGLRAGICQDHFDMSDYYGPSLHQLKAEAIPKVRNPNRFSDENRDVNTTSFEDLTPLDLPSELESTSFDDCIYINCDSTTSSKNVHFFPLPTNPPARSRLWLEACGYKNVDNVEIQDNFKVCSNHFTPVMFSKIDGQVTLKPHAVPMFSFESMPINKNCGKNKLYKRLNPTKIADGFPKELFYCAVVNCSKAYSKSSYKGLQHSFPDPVNDKERFDLWLKLVANSALDIESPRSIADTYIVCEEHFEEFFYSEWKTKSGSLSDVAVPTLKLIQDISWFFGTDHYLNKVKDYLRKKIFIGETENEIRWLPSNLIDKSEPKTACILEEDRLSFPGIGFHLYMDRPGLLRSKNNLPYDVYKFNDSDGKQTYIRTNEMSLGEAVQVHTAIIINDDDAMETKVIQELLKKQIQKRLQNAQPEAT